MNESQSHASSQPAISSEHQSGVSDARIYVRHLTRENLLGTGALAEVVAEHFNPDDPASKDYLLGFYSTLELTLAAQDDGDWVTVPMLQRDSEELKQGKCPDGTQILSSIVD